MTKENQKILQNIQSKSEEEFVHYDLALDCINPETEEPLIHASDDTLARFYAFRNNKIDYDADASLEANLIYEKVFASICNRIDRPVIRQQTGEYNVYGLKYELGVPNCTDGISFRGDTMNSVATTNGAYYRSHEELHYKETGEKFTFPAEALELIDLYHTPGNFMLLPWCVEANINCGRGTGNAKDYFDLFLMAIYNFFLVYSHKEWANNITLNRILNNKRTIAFMRGYLMSFIDDEYRLGNVPRQIMYDIDDGCMLADYVIPGWEAFVKKNMLQDFVEVGYKGFFGKPKELWNDHFEEFIKTRNALPQKEEEYFEFWKNTADWIRLRSKRIYNKMKNGKE